MSKKILLATKKPFAKQAVAKIQEICQKVNYDLLILEEYQSVDELIKILPGVHGLIVRSDKITEDIINEASDLNIIVRGGAGFDNVDINYAREKDIVVMNTPGQNANAVAELAIGMMIYTARNHFLPSSGAELMGKSLGLHAFGNVGKSLSKIAVGFNMKQYAFDPYIDQNIIKDAGIQPLDNVQELYQKSQYLSLHIPSNEHTKQSINYNLLSLMPEGAVLINTARKEIICEESLLKIFANREDFKYATDVSAGIHETLVKEYPNRYYATPKKMGAQTFEANLNAATAAINQIVDYFKEGNTTFQVNK